MFKNKPSHGLVLPQFLCALGIFFGIDLNITEMAITALYRNLWHGTLSGATDFSFDSVSNLTSGINFKIKELTLSNRNRKEKEDEISLGKINEDTTFVELPDQFEEDLIDYLFKDLEHKKTEHPYVEPQIQDAAKIETETKNANDEFFVFNKGLMSLMMQQQNKKNKLKLLLYLTILLMKTILLTINIKTDDIYIEDDLFDNNDSQDIKDISGDVIKTIDLSDNIENPSDNGLATDA